jgi:hypothetical protein
MTGIEDLFKLPFTSLFSLWQLVSDRPRLKLECGPNSFPNEDEVGNFLGFWVKVINPTKDAIYFERLEAKDSKGEIFFPSVLNNIEKEILPRRNVVLIIPCGHIANTTPKEISIVDATEKHHKLKGRKLSKAVAELKAEFERLESLGLEVHPRRK